MVGLDLRMPTFDYDPTALIIYGGGGHGKTLIELARASGMYCVVGVIDDELPPNAAILEVPVLGGANELPALYERGVRLAVNGVGGINKPEARWRIFEILAQAGFNFPALVHRTAWIDSSAKVEGGVQVLAQSYVSASAVIGFGSVLNAGVVVSHDCQIGSCVNLAPGALLAGGVRVEDFAQVGMGATVNLNLTIGRGARVGNGATVKADVPPGAVVYAGTIHPPR